MQTRFILPVLIIVALLAGLCPQPSFAFDDRYDAWLRYAPLTSAERARHDSFPSSVTVLSDSPVMDAAKPELLCGVQEDAREYDSL